MERVFCKRALTALALLLAFIANSVALSETESISITVAPGCGTIDEVIASKDARAAVPWAATIYYQSSQCDFRQGAFGQGVIIGPTTILMSGYFLWSTNVRETTKLLEFKPGHFMVGVGLKVKQPLQTDQYTQFMKVSHIKVHPNSYEKYSEHDIALIHLKTPIRFSSYVRPICIDNSPEGSLLDVNSTYKLGDLTLTGFRRGRPEKEPFGLLDGSICASKLNSELQDTNQAPDLTDIPCGLTSPSREDVRSWSGYGNGLIQARFLDFSQIARIKNNLIVPNICFQKGSALVTSNNGRSYLVGITGESLGSSCRNTVYFISFVSLQENLEWILKNVWFSTQAFVCNNGQTIELNKECNDFIDCDDGSDENPIYCSALKCSGIFSILYCGAGRCPESDSFKVVGQTHNFSVATSSEEIKCPPLKQPEGSLLHCENPSIRSRITCEHGSEPGTKAIFQCKNSKPNEPSSYCVITCKDDGSWTDELKSYLCKSPPGSSGSTSTGPVHSTIIGSQKNFTDWINNVLQNVNKTDASDELDNWSPPLAKLPSQIADKTGIHHISIPGKCHGFKAYQGLKITCRAPNSALLIDCAEHAEPGTKAEFACDTYFRPVFSAASMVKTCQSDGRWTLANRVFECRLDCGVPKSALVGHIVSGQVSEGAKWPWHTIIFRATKDGTLAYICGGTLISSRLILTAAHCVVDREGKALPPDKFIVVLGAASNVLQDNQDDPHSQVLTVKNVTVNPAFNGLTFESDIAIIGLEAPVKITDFVRPSCFPSTLTSHNELLHLSPGSEGTIVGFGYDESGEPSSNLREANLPVVSYPECLEVSKIQASSTMYCAGYTNGTAACNGDSGGGMFFEDQAHPRRVYLQGIVSHGNRDASSGLCDSNQYSVFTRVASFKNWIYEIGLDLDEDI